MAASTSRQTQTIAEQPSGSCGRGFDALELPDDGREDEMPALRMTPSPERKSFFSPDHIAKPTEFPPPSDETETKASGMLTCEVCGASFETRRGLSSHARSHLRQLGVLESSGAPIDLLYQLSKDKAMDGQLSPGLSRPLAAKKFPHRTSLKLERDVETPDGSSVSLSHLASTSGRSSSPTTLGRSRSASPMLRKAPISSLLPASHGHKSSTGKTASAGPRALTKPLWAPQDTDAPLNLTLDMDTSKDIVCQLCGAWFETRKGLSSHARAHLRHFGIVVESKGSPIDILNQVIHTDDFKHQVSALQHEISEEFGGTIACLSPPPPPRPPASAACSPVPSPAPRSQSSPLSSPSKKRPKVSLEGNAALRAFRLECGEQVSLSHNERSKEISCELCGEYFENRKGLSSHARSHLRQMGITEWTVNGSPIDTLGEVITRRRLPCAPPARTAKSPLLSPGSPRSPKRLSLPGGYSRPPTARKAGTPQVARLVSELKPDSAPLQLSAEGGPVRPGGYTANPLRHSWGGSDSVQPLSLVQTAKAQELDPTRDVRCELCGEYFENRKGLSSHARSHLRQMGITEWTVNGSPIDTLREVVHQRGGSPSEEVKKEPGLGSNPTLDEFGCLSRKPPLSPLPPDPRHHKPRSCGTSPSSAKGGGFSGVSQLGKRVLPEEGCLVEKCTPLSKSFSSPPPQDLTFKGKSSPDKNGSGRSDSSCELCGFYFENRKALASHARAHLRQFGVTRWCVNGSPIETLAAWIRSKPQKVAEIQRRYARGGWPLPKKKSYLSPSSDSEGLVSLTQKPLSAQSTSAGLPTSRRAGREVSGRVSASSRSAEGRAHARQTFALRNPQVAHSELNVRLPRGFERRPPKHLPHSEGGGREGGLSRPPRTGTVPALVPKPPSTPLVKMVGKLYSLKCRFCEVEFRGPLSVQEDWVRHLQQHILDLNFGKPGSPGASPPADAPGAATSASAAPVSLTNTSSALAAAPAPIPIAAQAV